MSESQNPGPSANSNASPNASLDELVRRIKAFTDQVTVARPQNPQEARPESRTDTEPASQPQPGPESRSEIRPEPRSEYRQELRPNQQATESFHPNSDFRAEPKYDPRPEFRTNTRESQTDPRPLYHGEPLPAIAPIGNGSRYEAYEDIRISPPLPSAGNVPAASSSGQAPYQPQPMPHQAAPHPASSYPSPDYSGSGHQPELNSSPPASSQSPSPQDPSGNRSPSAPFNGTNGAGSTSSPNYDYPLHPASRRDAPSTSESRPEARSEAKSEEKYWSGGSNSASNANPAQPATPPTPADPNAPISGLQRAVNAVRSALPLVQRLLPLLDGNFATAMNALVAPQPSHHQAPPVKVDLEPIERGLAEVSTSHRELRTQVLEQITTFKRVEDQLERVREATDRNTLEQQELVEDLRSVGTRLSTFAILGLILLLLSVAVNVFFLVQLQHILR